MVAVHDHTCVRRRPQLWQRAAGRCRQPVCVAGSYPRPLEQTSGDYVPISDQSGILAVEVPDTWTDVEETEWTMDDEAVGTKLAAAPNLEDFYADWGIPGVVLSYSESLPQEMTAEELLDTIDYSDTCEAGDRDEITDGPLVGCLPDLGELR